MTHKHTLQKLELTWIGKGDEPKLEPRILIENPEYSYRDPNTGNMLIHGDNLLALKALEQDYTGKVKCIYIDPPYNTGSAFEHYDDNLEHSIWLNLMSIRLTLLRTLLKNDGFLWISIDDKEVHYLKILCDEVFGRDNYISTVCVKMSTASGVKTSHREKTIIKEKEFVLCYAKNASNVKLNPQYVPKIEWDDEFQYFLEKNNSENPDHWQVKRLKDILKDKKIDFDPSKENFQKFITKNASSIWRRAFIRNDFKELSQNNPDKIFVDSKGENYYYRGRQMYFFSDRIHTCFTEEGYLDLPSFLLGDFWSDINTGKLFNEGGIDFRNGKKPEFLVARIIEMSTEKGDLVFDSFLGSGTTAAVAHKMGRRWIGVELGEHAKTHCFHRLKQVVDGEQGGISKAVNWQGGGGFKFYTLAPSLLNQDKFGNWVISTEYNAQMLAAAMTKQEGFTFQPDTHTYWKQGRSSEHDYIYVTTQFLTVEVLESIHDEMQPGESLLVCCKAFQKECKHKYPNITLKKIPQMLLGRCEFGKDDYSLNIVNMPVEEKEEVELEEEFEVTKESVQEIRDKIIKNNELTLFD
jgi:adenine-specific DNA-methyltransferase